MRILSRMFLACAAILLTASASRAGIINGSFEDLGGQTFQNGTWGLFDAVPGWTKAAGGAKIEIGTGGTYGVSGFVGNNVLELDSTANAIVSQVVAVPGGSYELSFLGARRNNVNQSSTSFEVYWNNQLVGSYFPTLTAMTLYKANVTALASNTLEFRGTGASDSYGALVDDVQLKNVPDGGLTLSLLGAALGGLGLLRRRLR